MIYVGPSLAPADPPMTAIILPQTSRLSSGAQIKILCPHLLLVLLYPELRRRVLSGLCGCLPQDSTVPLVIELMISYEVVGTSYVIWSFFSRMVLLIPLTNSPA